MHGFHKAVERLQRHQDGIVGGAARQDLSSRLRALGVAFALLMPFTEVLAAPIEPPILAEAVAAGALPPMAERLPAEPRVIDLAVRGRETGHPGGHLDTLMSRSKDIRLMTVYGYSRLVAYDSDFRLVPDILRDITVEEGRVFTLHLRPGHRWSDGYPFTTEDFLYWWDDMANNPVISPSGPPPEMTPHGAPPVVEVLDERTIRYAWAKPNPLFLPALAAARPLEIYRPAHYLRPFHADHADPDTLAALVKAEKKRDWRALHFEKDRWYRNTNPDRPSLDPWVNTTAPPAQRFVFRRNPYFHRVDETGQQLPYMDAVVITITDPKLVPARVGAGEVSLQARYLDFANFTFLRAAEGRNGLHVMLWREGKGASVALYPNLTTRDPVWRAVLRQADFRRALALAIDRREVNQVVFFGLGMETNNTMLRASPLHRDRNEILYARLDVAAANALLDGLGYTERDSQGIRLLPDGRPMELIVEEDGESVERLDALRLIQDQWARIGVRMFIRTFSREVLKNRIYTGSPLMVAASGLNNGLATPIMPPTELVPISQDMWQWSKWGQYRETRGAAGEPVDMPEVQRLLDLYDAWMLSDSETRQAAIWDEILSIHAEQQFSIGVLAGGMQPVARALALRNVPEEALYNWDPGAHFGIHGMDTFFLAPSESGRAE